MASTTTTSKRRRVTGSSVRVEFRCNRVEYILTYLAGLHATFEPVEGCTDAAFTMSSLSQMEHLMVPQRGSFEVKISPGTVDVPPFLLHMVYPRDVTMVRPGDDGVMTLEIPSDVFETVRDVVIRQALRFKGAAPSEAGSVRMFWNKYPEDWSQVTTSPPCQALDHMFLPEGKLEQLLERVRMWEASAARNRAFGRVHKLGVLLEGRPGMGKSSLIRALARHTDRPLYTMNLSRAEATSVEELVAAVKPHSILAFEDIDASYHGRDAVPPVQVPFNTFLNLIDGNLAFLHDVIVVFTANDRSKLDEALTRAGRMDHSITFGNVTQGMFERASRAVHPDAEPNMALFREHVQRHRWSMSKVLDVLLSSPTTPTVSDGGVVDTVVSSTAHALEHMYL